jgi:transcriptional regulator with XRE-family HTH domain
MPIRPHIRKPSRSVIGERIDLLCMEHRTCKSDLAAVLDTDRVGLSRWRMRESPPRSITTLIAIADHFGVSLDWLTGRTEHREEGGDQADPAPAPPRKEDARRLEIEERIRAVRGAKIAKVRRGKFEKLTVKELDAVFSAGAGRCE